jgi:hypothetical protein
LEFCKSRRSQDQRIVANGIASNSLMEARQLPKYHFRQPRAGEPMWNDDYVVIGTYKSLV